MFNLAKKRKAHGAGSGLLLAWLLSSYFALGQDITASPTTLGSAGNGVLLANAFNSLQAAIDNCPQTGCRVYLPAGVYTISEPLYPKTGMTLDCAGGSIGGSAGVQIRVVSAPWALENPNPSTYHLNGLTVNNCTFDISADPEALGGLNLRAISSSRFIGVTILLPPSGSMDGVRLDGQDSIHGIPAYFNEFYGLTVLANTSGTAPPKNHHNGVHWINQANSNHFYGGSMYALGTFYKLDESNNSIVVGGGGDAWQHSCVDIGDDMQAYNNSFISVRCETFVGSVREDPSPAYIRIGARATDNRIVSPHAGNVPGTVPIVDDSQGKNMIEISAGGGHASYYTISNRYRNMMVGINKNSNIRGLDVSGALRGDRLQVVQGVSPSPGIQHQRFVIGCSTIARAAATCTSKSLIWKSAFVDTSYSVACSLEKTRGQPHIVSVTKSSASIQVTIASDTNSESTGTIDCIAMHD